MLKSYLLSLLFLIVPVTFLFAQEKPLEPVSVQLKWFYQYQFAGILMAKEKGFYEKAGLDVTIKERDPAFNNIQQVIEGKSEYGLADSVIIRYRAEGHPVKVIATIFQHNAMVLISKKESGIVSPYEMRGKRISYQEGLDDSVITSLLSFANLEKDDIIKRPMDFSHMNLVNGDVDITEAYISIEPYWMKQKYGLELNIIDPKNYGIDFYGDMIFTTEDEIKNHPKRVEAFKHATLEGWAYALQHKEEAINIILQKYNTRDLNYEQLLYEARATENLIATQYIPLGEVRKERFKILSDLYLVRGIPKDDLDKAIEEIVYDPNAKSDLLVKYLYPIIIAAFVLVLLVLFLTFYNKRLSYLVTTRTEELEKAKQEAELSALSKANFLANMSHEIRTPMNAILGFVEQLAKNEENLSRQKMFSTVQNSGHSLLTIINDILEISKIESGKMQLDPRDCDLHHFLNDIHEFFVGSCENKEITFRLRVDSNVPQCARVDEIRLRQILVNLISNAVKFTPEQGNISLDVIYNAEGENIEIFIVDTGIGISKDNIEKIFNAFEQEDSSTTRRFGGTGLGLAICKRLITLMDGNIHVESEVGKGSRFYLRFPYHACDTDFNTDKTEDESSSSSLLTGKVLVVEDNKTNQMLMCMILDEFNLSYDIAQNGEEAVRMYKEYKDYDIILMDENMPVMNGVEAVKHIRQTEEEEKRKALPVIAVTANALSTDKARFLDAGMDDYIAKPYTEKSIREILSKYM
jgi:signal transduction histidine kinase/CheY-like chemotaxis protein